MKARSQILSALASHDPDARGVALERLEALDAPTDAGLVAALIDLLAAPSKQIRRRAADLLAAACDDPGPRGLLGAALNASDARLRWGAAFALHHGGFSNDEVFRVALWALGQDDADIRWSAAGIVCQRASGHPELVSRLTASVGSGSPTQRRMALYCLRDLGERRVDVYLAGLEDEDPGVRLAALAALVRCGADAHAFVERLELCRDDADAGVRRAAAAVREKIMQAEDDLAAKSCVPCHGGVPALDQAEARKLLARLDGWRIVDGHHLQANFEFADFVSALAFVNAVAGISESEGHHPDLHLAWGKVGVEIWTHAVDGLTESDFVLAAKIDRLKRG